MKLPTILTHWIDVLAGLVVEWRALSQARKSVVVTRDEGGFVIHRGGQPGGDILAKVGAGMPVASETIEALRNHLIVFELSADHVINRNLTLPVKAKEFLSGIVRNQLERLSPWPPAQALYAIDAKPSAKDPEMLEVSVLLTPREEIEAVSRELALCGLSPGRIAARIDAGAKTPFLTLWTKPAPVSKGNIQNLPRMIGIGLAAVIVLSTTASLWALYASNAASTERDDIAEQASTLERQARAQGKPNLALLKPPERAWALKENSPVAVLVLDDLTRAVPDSAYLTEFHLETTTLRIMGLANDAPSLIGALEQSGHFSNVHFFAATTQGHGQSTDLYKFYIEARVSDHPDLPGD
ncbi:PilN domain-containing protein [Methyloferula stellata]|uniref:PilN domain-containing protein n=1 Tax=Methyloferula stellata TaxID=876270 RepID=UPI0003774832|nr:PilN domain-containing protein [Methyloferula stellata]